MVIEIIRPWRWYSPGQIYREMPGGMAQVLVDRNIAKVVEDEPKTVTKKKRAKRKRLGVNALESNDSTDT